MPEPLFLRSLHLQILFPSCVKIFQVWNTHAGTDGRTCTQGWRRPGAQRQSRRAASRRGASKAPPVETRWEGERGLTWVIAWVHFTQLLFRMGRWRSDRKTHRAMKSGCDGVCGFLPRYTHLQLEGRRACWRSQWTEAGRWEESCAELHSWAWVFIILSWLLLYRALKRRVDVWGPILNLSSKFTPDQENCIFSPLKKRVSLPASSQRGKYSQCQARGGSISNQPSVTSWRVGTQQSLVRLQTHFIVRRRQRMLHNMALFYIYLCKPFIFVAI